MDESEVLDSASMYVYLLGLAFVNLNEFFRDDFLEFTLDWPDSKDPISLMYCIG